jgi:hypothetical protein
MSTATDARTAAKLAAAAEAVHDAFMDHQSEMCSHEIKAFQVVNRTLARIHDELTAELLAPAPPTEKEPQQ